MKFNDYTKFVRHADFTTEARERWFLAALGLAGETGEVVDEMKKVLIHRKPFDRAKMVDELGDVTWYLSLMCDTLGISLEEIMEGNIRKLCERYPEQNGDPEPWIAGERKTRF